MTLQLKAITQTDLVVEGIPNNGGGTETADVGRRFLGPDQSHHLLARRHQLLNTLSAHAL